MFLFFDSLLQTGQGEVANEQRDAGRLFLDGEAAALRVAVERAASSRILHRAACYRLR